jgi:hypothetical protein
MSRWDDEKTHHQYSVQQEVGENVRRFFCGGSHDDITIPVVFFGESVMVVS